MVLDWWLRYECSCLVYILTPPVFAYCKGFYLAGGSKRDRIIAIAKVENLVMCFRYFFAATSMGTRNIPSDMRRSISTKAV